MTDDEFRAAMEDAGRSMALWEALLHVIDSHPNPAIAAKSALRAVERAIANRLHKPSMPEATMDAMIDLQERLSAELASRDAS